MYSNTILSNLMLTCDKIIELLICEGVSPYTILLTGPFKEAVQLFKDATKAFEEGRKQVPEEEYDHLSIMHFYRF